MKTVKPELQILFKISASQPKIDSLLINKPDQFTNIKELTSIRFKNKIKKKIIRRKGLIGKIPK